MQRHVPLLLFAMMPFVTSHADERRLLSEDWQLQPAEHPTKKPTTEPWAAGTPTPWMWKGALRRIDAWKKLNVDDVHSLWYRKAVELPAEWRGGRVVLDFHRVEGDAVVFCNGKRVDELLRPGGEIELTDAVEFGADNEILVFVTRAYAGISRDFAADPLRYHCRGPEGRNLPMLQWGLGITAPVELIRRPSPLAIAGAFVRPSWRHKHLAVDVDLESGEEIANARLELTVAGADEGVALTSTHALPVLATGRATETVTVDWPDPIPWELDGPHLYALSLRLMRGNDAIDALNGVRFGFREVWTEGRHVYLNGHVSRWRIEWTNFGINANSVSLLKLLGRNVLYAQNNPAAWWLNWSETPYYSDSMLNLLDESGIGLVLPVPSVSTIRDLALRDKMARSDFRREMALSLRRYRNHPCILSWCVSMNSFNPPDAIHPATLGQRSDYSHLQAKAISDAIAIAKSLDPTRLGYGHADGNLSDIATANTYPNFSPVQEVEDWPEIWAEKGNMPYFAAEFALPYNGSFYNKTQFLGTEFAAMYFGDEAYRQESEELLRQTVDIGLGNKGHGNSIGTAISLFPMYWTLRGLYVTRCDRAWRTWGVQGWHYFNFGQGYGDPPGEKINRFGRYSVLREPVIARPDWANPNFDMHSVAMQPLLAYLVGHPDFTDKTHAYYVGESIGKQIAVVWDGPGARHLVARWSLRQGDEVLAAGTVTIDAKAGDIVFVPVECLAPVVTARTELALLLDVTEAGEAVTGDRFELQVFPRPDALGLGARVAIWDPQGRTSEWLGDLGVSAVPVQPGDSLTGYDVLLVGREALTPGVRMPYADADVQDGLRVVVFAQKPGMWEALGFRPDDLMSRRVFPCAGAGDVLSGLEDADWRDWRCSPDLLPAFRRVYGHDAQRAPRSSNRGTVASVVLRLPDVVGFTPLLQCEFDLDYTPLLRWRHGNGSITFCTLDLEERVGTDPAATRLAVNLLRTVSAPLDPLPAAFVVTPDQDFNSTTVTEMVREGGRAVILRPSSDKLQAAGFAVKRAEFHRVPTPSGPLFAAIGPRLLRWRDAVTLDAFAPEGQPGGCTVSGGGLFLAQQLGKGQRLFAQVSPDLLDGRYADDPGKRAAMRLSAFRLRQLTAQLLTNAGVAPDSDVAERICGLRAGPAFETLTSWHVLGPFYPENASPADALAAVFPGEENAVAGNTNPNSSYEGADGKMLDFRTTVGADANGFVNLGAALTPDAPAVAYATRTVENETKREATLRLGVDYFMQVWVNGETVYRLTGGHGSPKPNRHQVKVVLRPGLNVITLKVFAGSKGFGFWANLSTPGATPQRGEDAPGTPMYPPDIDYFDPYEYHYW